MIAGGVSANEPLRKAAQQLCNKKGIDLILPNKEFCTDNAAMIAAAGSFKADLMNYEPAINIYPRWSISDVK
jgi:N6-L-threonylcarbamoyladenine synthase